MNIISLPQGSRALAKEQKFVRDLVKDAIEQHGDKRLKVSRDINRHCFGDSIVGYQVEFNVINQKWMKSTKRSNRLHIDVSTLGSHWDCRPKPDRIHVKIGGVAKRSVTGQPKPTTEMMVTRSATSETFTIDRNRPRDHIVNALSRAIGKVLPTFDAAVKNVDSEVEHWHKYYDRLRKLAKKLGIPVKHLWHQHSVEWHLDMPPTQSRKLTARINTSKNSNAYSIRISNLSEHKLKQIVALIKK